MFTPKLPAVRPCEISDGAAANALKLIELSHMLRSSPLGTVSGEPPTPAEIHAGQLINAYFEQEAAKLRAPKPAAEPGTGLW